jgi:TRAP-type C4-dicarboxylate transport system substrate-binding protein
MKKKIWALTACVLVLMTTLLLLPACSSQQQVASTSTQAPAPSTQASTQAPKYATGGTIKISYSCPKGKGYSAGEEWMTTVFSDRTGGRWKVEAYGASTLVPITAVLDSTRSGVCQIGLTSTAQFAKDFPLSMMTQTMGFGWPAGNIYENWAKAATPAFEEFAKIPEVAAELNNGFIYGGNDLLSSNMLVMKSKQVHVPADLKGTKIGTVGGFADIVAANGGATVAIVVPEMYTNLEKGVIDGAPMSATMCTDWKMQTLCDYFYGMDQGTGSMLVLYNKEFYNSLSPEDKKIFDDTRAEALQKTRDFMTKSDVEAFKILANDGKTIVQPTAEENAAWKKAVQDIWLPKWRADAKSVGVSDAVLDKVYNAWISIRAKYWKQYNLPGEP